jgi:hypothetical protein
MLENQMVIGDYYDEERHTEPDEDEAYERMRQIEIDEAADAKRRSAANDKHPA